MSDDSVDLEKFSTSKVQQLTKITELQGHHMPYKTSGRGSTSCANQLTEAPVHRVAAGKYKKKRLFWKSKQTIYKHQVGDSHKPQVQQKKKSDTKGALNDRNRCSKCGDIVHLEGFQCPTKKYQCKACHKFGHFTSMCYQKKHAYSKLRRPKAHQLQAGAVYMHNSASYDHLDDDSTADDSFCMQVKINHKQKNKGFQGQHIWLSIWPIDCNLITIEIYIWGPGSTHVLMST